MSFGIFVFSQNSYFPFPILIKYKFHTLLKDVLFLIFIRPSFVIPSIAEESLKNENTTIFCLYHGKREWNSLCWDDKSFVTTS